MLLCIEMTKTDHHIPRTQADRRAQTRRALLEATIEVLQTKGYDGCSLAKVAKHAGLTTGSVQHHFNTKAHLLLAVIEENLFENQDTETLGAEAKKTLLDRCRFLVERQWQYYSDPKYLAIWSIILGGRSDSEIMEKIAEWQQNAISKHERAIKDLFADVKLKPSQIRSIQYFVNAQLRGLALLQTVDPNPVNIKKQIHLLVTMIEAQISKA